MLVKPSLRLAFRKQEELSGRALVSTSQISKKGVILSLGSIILIPPTVFMKPSSYLRVMVNWSTYLSS